MIDLIRAAALSLLMLLAAPTANAGEASDYVRASGYKLGHGALSILYAPADLVTTPTAFAVQMDQDGRAPLGFGFGVPAGMANGAVRLLTGAWSVITFPFVDVNKDRRFDVEPMLTGWSMLSPRPAAASRPAFSPSSRRLAPSRD